MADPDLQIRARGGGHPDHEIRRGPVWKIFFAALRASVWSKHKEGGPRLDPPLVVAGIHRQVEDLAFFPLRSFFPTSFVYICIEDAVQIGGLYYMRRGFVCPAIFERRVPDFIALFTFTSVGEFRVKQTDYCKIRIEVFNLFVGEKSSINSWKPWVLLNASDDSLLAINFFRKV